MRVAALLRGVNLGKRQVKMAALRDAVAALGHTDVETYLASGNVVFTPKGRLAGLDARARPTALGMPIETVVRTGKELAAIVEGNPYPVEDPTKVVVVFLGDKRPKSVLAGFDQEPFAPERFTFTGRELYVDLPGGQARSKLMVELAKVKLGTVTTTRNWRTVESPGHRADRLTRSGTRTHPLRGDGGGAVGVEDGQADGARLDGVEGEAAEAVARAARPPGRRTPAARSARSAGSAGRRHAGRRRRPPSPRSPTPGARNVSWRAVSSLRTPVSSSAESKTSSASSASMVRHVHAARAPATTWSGTGLGGAEGASHHRQQVVVGRGHGRAPFGSKPGGSSRFNRSRHRARVGPMLPTGRPIISAMVW